MSETKSEALTPTPSTGLMLTALLVGGITAILDTTIVAIGLHTLTEELHASVATIQWVSTGYLLALAIAIPFVSWAQSRFGGKRLWLFALGLFTLGSVLCACAWNAESLIAFRVLQGLGGGVMVPLMQTLAMQNIAPAERTKAMATIGVPAALGPILGPVLGGFVLNWLDWHWLFLINVPIGIAGWILAMFCLPADTPSVEAPRQRLDVFGVILLAPALAGLLYGLSNAHLDGGFSRGDVLIPGIGGVILLAGFIGWALHKADGALVDIRLLAVRSVRASSITLTFLGAALYAGTFLLPLYFQTLRGYGVLDAALLMIPQGLGSLVARFGTSAIVEKFGSRTTAVAAFLVITLATVPFAFADADTNLWYLGSVLFVRGLGLGVVMIPVMTVAYLDVSKGDMAHASAITRIAQQLGGAFGTAVIAVVLAAYTTRTHPEAGFDAAFWWAVGITIIATIVAFLLPSRETSVATAPTAAHPTATRLSRKK